jgi:AcrR family transcriptional regulator
MEDVARAARLAVGTIYNYFPSKNDLVLAIVRRETNELYARAEQIAGHPPADAPTRRARTYPALAWRHDYNHLRPHSSLGALTPTEFAVPKGQEVQPFQKAATSEANFDRLNRSLY